MKHSMSVGESPSKKRVKTAPVTKTSKFVARLLRTPIEALRPANDVIFVASRDDNVTDVFKGLVTHQYYSVPVIQKTKQKYYGSVDQNDILSAVIDKFGDAKLKDSTDFWHLLEQEESFQKLKVKDVMAFPLTRRNTYHPHSVPKGFSLLYAAELLAKEKHLHRLVAIDSDRTIWNVLTQSHLASFILQHIDEVEDETRQLPVSEFVSETAPVSIVKTEITIDAFKKMSSEQLSGLAVVDEKGTIIDTVSVRDLKIISTDAKLFWRLYTPLSEFLLHVADEFKQKNGKERVLVTVSETDTLEHCVRTLVSNHLHRLFVVQSDGRAHGVVSLKDVLYAILFH